MATTISQRLHTPWSFPLIKTPRSLRTRLVLLNTLTLSLTLVILGSIVYSLVAYYLLISQDKRLETQGEKLQLATTIWLSTGHPINTNLFNQLTQSVQQDEFTSDPLYIKVFDTRSGEPIQSSPNLLQQRILYSRNDFNAALHGQKTFSTYEDSNGNQVRVQTLPLLDLNNHVIAVAQVGRSLASTQQVESLLSFAMGVGGICAIFVVYIISFWLTTQELCPLYQLSTIMKDLGMQGLGIHVESKKQASEIKALVDAFNQMSERLEAGFTLQRNFVADVSHELRTPLTSLRGQIEILFMSYHLSEEATHDLRQIQAELLHLSRVVSNLLMMARAEIGMLPQVSGESLQRVELDLLLVEVARQARFLKQEVTLEFGELQQIITLGDADLLKQLLMNIVENALTYTPSGGSVTLEVICTSDVPEALKAKYDHEQDSWARITIRDTGPGIAPIDLPHIFERNYRAAQARSRSKLGAGLGLALARLIAQAHEGEITVESELTRGACFSVWLPVCRLMAATESTS